MRKISMFAPIVAVLVAAGVLFEAATSSLVGADVPATAIAGSQADASAERASATGNWVETGNPDQGNNNVQKSKDKPFKPTNH